MRGHKIVTGGHEIIIAVISMQRLLIVNMDKFEFISKCLFLKDILDNHPATEGKLSRGHAITISWPRVIISWPCVTISWPRINYLVATR